MLRVEHVYSYSRTDVLITPNVKYMLQVYSISPGNRLKEQLFHVVMCGIVDKHMPKKISNIQIPARWADLEYSGPWYKQDDEGNRVEIPNSTVSRKEARKQRAPLTCWFDMKCPANVAKYRTYMGEVEVTKDQFEKGSKRASRRRKSSR